jgi:hypothetical protein
MSAPDRASDARRRLPAHAPGGDGRGSWRETRLFVGAGGLLLLAMTLPAFRTFFFAENFEYLGLYQTRCGDFWRALLGPTNRIFFRPVFFASSLPWYYVLPLEPWAYHLRNFAFSVVNLLLLHRVLLGLVASRRARAAAFFLFALSKVHLTVVGYINIFDAAVSLMLLLATVLFFLRFAAGRRRLDYSFGLLFCLLSIFAKDYGLAITLVVVALAISYGLSRDDWRGDALWWARRLLPLPLMVLLYLSLRYAAVGPLPTDDPVYSPQLSFEVAAIKLLIFTSTLGNLSFAANGITGASGLGAWLTADAGPLGPWLSRMVRGNIARVSWGDAAQHVALMALLVVTLWRTHRGAGLRLLCPLVWIAAYLGPTLLTRNLQMYYNYEPLAGAAVLLGVCLDGAGRRLLGAWAAALLVVGANGAVSNYASHYGWQYVADSALRARRPVVEAYRGRELESVTFATAERGLWQFALGGEGYPLLPVLTGRPGLEVRFVSREELPALAARADASNPVFDIDQGFAAHPAHAQPSRATARGDRRADLRCEPGITATPNPALVGKEAGATTIRWNVGDGSQGRVTVSRDGGPEVLFAEGSRGSAVAPWLRAGSTYEFRLYRWREPPQLIGAIKVTGGAR